MVNNLQKMREAAGLSQRDLAEAAGINKRVLQTYEQGQRDIGGAKLATQLKICIALKCSLYDIMPDGEERELLKQYSAL